MDFPASSAVAFGFGLMLPHAIAGSVPGTVLLAEALLGAALIRIVWVAFR